MSENSILGEIGIVRFLRYGYGGLLLALLAAILAPASVHSLVEALGPVLAPLAALCVGAGVYVVHRYVIGEVLLYPSLHGIHQLVDRLGHRSGPNATDTVGYLKGIGVERGRARTAYSAARREFFPASLREQLDLVHSELHILWITIDETLLAWLYLGLHGRWVSPLFLIGVSVGICGAVADIKQHQLECHRLKTAEAEGVLLPFLKARGYLK